VKEGEVKKDGGDGDVGGFSAVENVFLIFGGPTVAMSNSQRKRERHEVLAVEKAPPSFLDWSEDAITFSHEDHPNRIPNPGQYPPFVDPVIGNARFSKVLMDGGSSLNILYAHTLHLLGIGLDQLRPSTTPFHGVVPGKHVQPLGQIDLPVWFGTPDNFRKETLSFEVVGFKGAYHTILGWSCYAKFMAVPNYTYLKMKMLGPKGVITVGSLIEHAFDYDVECVEHAKALALDEALVAGLEKLVNEDLDSAAKHAGSFEAAEQTKEVPLDPTAPEGKVLRVSSTLDPKYEVVLVDFLRANADIFAWSPSDMPGILMEVAEHSLDILLHSRAVQQRLRHFDVERHQAIGVELRKLLEAGFIKEVFHPMWLANPVLVKKKNGKWQMFVDYTSLNKACPKVPFPLPQIDQIVDSTSGCELLCFTQINVCLFN
jgi:hypothetical protein